MVIRIKHFRYPGKCQAQRGCPSRRKAGGPQPYRELLDDLLSLLQAGLQTADELKVLGPGRPLPWLLSGIFQPVSGRHAVSPLLQLLSHEQGE